MTAIAKWFYPVVVLALLWNLMGLFVFWTDVTMTPEQIAAMPAAMQEVYHSRPLWSVLATATAVIGGTLGTILLLLRLPLATPLLVVSLLGVVLQDLSFALQPAARALVDQTVIILQGSVLLIALGLCYLARLAGQRGWLKTG
ncbi:hypothetical protein [Rheinheimera sp. F8]|uniref:hypothetical protein n=1 Tax=Rheinheimera sp. F8 TaxID=1763998 RepID=UPI000744BE6A|nr:hypothetical protein [Rheinheimera sp. F8]ALZ75248.1 hypothetical protein ATY27_05405 [Rheinheimera sp. F8]ALZ76327.1 hypothetical protein ATY27_11545 [Rheinheimera sp. F8]